MPLQWLCACACVLLAKGFVRGGMNPLAESAGRSGRCQGYSTSWAAWSENNRTPRSSMSALYRGDELLWSNPFAGTAGSVVWRIVDRKEAY